MILTSNYTECEKFQNSLVFYYSTFLIIILDLYRRQIMIHNIKYFLKITLFYYK